MGKIKITQKQAELLGLNKINENKVTETKKLRITKEQYDRLLSSGLLKETVTPLDIIFNKDTESEIPEAEAPEVKPETVDIEGEMKEFLKFLYHESKQLSPFWEQNGLSYEDICAKLKAEGIIIGENGNYAISKTLGDAEAAKTALKMALSAMIGQGVEPEGEMDEIDTRSQGSPDYIEPKHNKGDQSNQPMVYEVIYTDETMALLKKDGKFYFFNWYDSRYNDNNPKTNIINRYLSSSEDETGSVENDWNNEDMQNFINAHGDELNIGVGKEGFDDGYDLVELDNGGMHYLKTVYSLKPDIINILNKLSEGVGNFKANVKKSFNEPSKADSTKSREELRAAELARRDAEKKGLEKRYKTGDVDETTASASGAFTGPLNGPINRDIEEEVIDETTTAGAGNFQYDTPGGLTMDLGKSNPKSKAEKTPQWAGGSFVKQPECSKPNNNKTAQNGGCNSGASSLKTIKAKGSINAPSLGESEIFEAIAKSTGKSIDEVRQIIGSKKPKSE